MFAISPLDGRYNKDVSELEEYFSEYALMHTRFCLELEYLSFISSLLKKDVPIHIENIISNIKFDENSYNTIKEFEKITNHDVKSVELYIKSLMKDCEVKELVHIGLTSHDINNVSNTINIRNFSDTVMEPLINELCDKLNDLSRDYIIQPMLSRTHGQPATPTTLGKEFFVYYNRLYKQFNQLNRFVYTCKFGGAVGLLNAHHIIDPNINWGKNLTKFVNQLGLKRDIYTTQLNTYDNLSELLSIFQRISVILIDLCQDLWLYISMDYFKLKLVKNEVGSSTMPHKINPIFFENAEGNLGLAISLINHFQNKLPISRLQRDLTDSTVIRNIGSIFGYITKAVKSILKGMDRLDINTDKINSDLDNNWAIITEGIQTVLRYEGYNNAYEALKEFSRGNHVTKESLHNFINNLNINDKVKDKLKNITPFNYLGFLS